MSPRHSRAIPILAFRPLAIAGCFLTVCAPALSVQAKPRTGARLISEATFPERIRRLSVGHTHASRTLDVLRILGRPTSITLTDPQLHSAEDGSEMWYYGRLLAPGLPADGKVWIDTQGRVATVTGGLFSPPLPNTMSPAEWKSALAAVHAFPYTSTAWKSPDPGTSIRLHNRLWSLGRRNVLIVLREYFRLTSLSSQDRTYTGLRSEIRPLLGLLFPEEALEPSVGPSPSPCLFAGIPSWFSGRGGFTGSWGIWLDEFQRIWAKSRLRETPLVPTNDPLRVPDEARFPTEWGVLTDSELRYYSTAMKGQLLRMLEPAMAQVGMMSHPIRTTVEIERAWSAAQASLRSKSLRWNEAIGRYEVGRR